MLIKKSDEIKSSEITDEKHYLNRRNFVRAALLTATTTATGLLYRKLATPSEVKSQPNPTGTVGSGFATGYLTPEGDAATDFKAITNYNNFYEFTTDKQDVAVKAKNFVSRPWSIEVSGLAHRPGTFDIEGLLKLNPQEERTYRLRCVEGWSMVIPWLGFPLSKLLDRVQPMSEARFIKFITLYDPKRMPNQSSDDLPWPYVEGLRIDEAMHPLTILATGLYGKMLPPQNGAPLRLVVPWKYGFKSIKSIVQIVLTDKQPKTTWSDYAPNEYGFYSNVNPQVSHPRWSQATERRIGEFGRRDTLLFNGYGEHVAQLYAGLDLKSNY